MTAEEHDGVNYMRMFKRGDTVVLNGDSSELGLSDYNFRVDTTAIVVETPKDKDKEVFVNIMEIDGYAYVYAYVLRDKISLLLKDDV